MSSVNFPSGIFPLPLAAAKVGAGGAGSALTGAASAGAVAGATSGSQPAGPSFLDQLRSALAGVNDLQLKSEQASAALAAGQITDLHQVTLLTEQASLALQFTIQVRNKLLEAYQEISRMPV